MSHKKETKIRTTNTSFIESSDSIKLNFFIEEPAQRDELHEENVYSHLPK